MLKIASLIREKNRKKKIFVRYVFLWLSAILVPFLVFTTTPKQFFILESVIFGLQFAVIIYSVITETKDALKFFRKIVVENMY
jgi:peptidoglycan/LPS O-acetylase OafA/YrhL